MNRKVFAILLIGGVLFLLIQGFNSWRYLHDGKTHLIFCDVGQGDGIIIKSPQGKIVLLDGGPDNRFVSCLSQLLPFWYRHVDLMIVSHPHVDHFLGDIPLLNSHKVDQFATEDLKSDQKAYQLLLSLLHDKGVEKRVLSLGDEYSVGGLKLKVVGPSKELLARSSPHGQIGESKEFASLLLLLRYGEFSAILPGDSQAPEMEEAVRRFGLQRVTVLQSPHHGSATGLTEEIVKELKPKLGVISVGKHNRYGHPAASTLSLFESEKTPVVRTDQHGTIEIVTDGKSFWRK